MIELDRRYTAHLFAIVLALELVAIVSIGAAPAAAVNNTTADYYENTTPDVDNASWMAGRSDPTLHNTTDFLNELQMILIGGSGGSSRTLLIGLLIMGFIGAAAAGSRLGSVAGAVIGIASIGGLFAAGFVPEWLYGILLFVLGIVGMIVWRRAWGE